MEFAITVERKEKLLDDTEQIRQELERKAELDAARMNGRTPTIEEALYHLDEDAVLDIKDLVNDATNE